MTMPRTLRFYFDFISPYAYLGWVRVQSFARERDLVLEPVPTLFAALLNTHGHKGPAEIPPKRVYVWKNVVRIAKELDVPIEPPPAHPFNPLPGLRVASVPTSEGTRNRIIDALFDATWAGGGGIGTMDAITRILDGLELDGRAWAEKATTPETKSAVKVQTEKALERGVFGVPSFGVDEEIFWGQDSLPHLDSFLKGEDPIQDDMLAKWKDLPAAARR